MTQDILYIPGFNSSGRASEKWQYIEALPNVYARIFQRNYRNIDPLDMLEELAKAVHHMDDPIIIGHSLGGLFARLVANWYGYRCLLINPSLQPQNFLFADDTLIPSEWKKTYESLSEKALRVRGFNHIHSLPAEIVLTSADERIDHSTQSEYYERSKLIVDPDGDHAYKQLNRIGDAISELSNRPWL